jgi:multiple sugar transport system substrate-binding protein
MVNSSGSEFSAGVSRRRFLSLTGGLAAAAALAACGSNTGRGGSQSSGSATANTSVTLSQWYHQYGEAGTQQAVQRYAKAYPKAKVTVQWTPGDYDKKVGAALLTGSSPDVFEAANGPSIDQIQGGQVVPLDGALGDAASDFNASLIQRMTYKGKLYAIPQVIDTQLLVYRKSLLSKAGLQPPQTFDELVNAAKKLTTKDMKGLFVGNDGGGGVLAGPILWSVGADYLTENDKVGFDNPNVAVAFGRLHELFTSGSLLLGAPTDWSDPSAFIQGLTAMQWTGLWTFPELQKAFGDDFGVLPWPKFSASVGAPSVPIGAYGAAVSAKSKNVAAAKDYVKWLWVDQTDSQLDFAQSYGFHIPARKSVASKADKLKSGTAAEAVALVTEHGRAQTPLLWTPASGTALSDAVTRIVKNGADPAAQLKTVRATVQSELNRVAK